MRCAAGLFCVVTETCGSQWYGLHAHRSLCLVFTPLSTWRYASLEEWGALPQTLSLVTVADALWFRVSQGSREYVGIAMFIMTWWFSRKCLLV